MRRDEVKALKEQKIALLNEIGALRDSADEFAGTEEGGGEWRGEDVAKFDQLEKEIRSLGDRLEKAHRTEILGTWDPADALPADTTAPANLAEFRRVSAAARVQDLPEVRSAVYSWMVHGREMLEAEEYRVLSKAASGGGFLVPTELANEIIRAMRFMGPMGSIAREIVTSTGDSFLIPTNLTHGTAAWLAESAAFTPSDETLTQASLAAFKAGTKIIISEELLNDSAFDLSGFVSQEFGERLGVLSETAFLTGDGSGKPQGILDAGASVAVVTLPAGQVTTLTYAALVAALANLPVQYRDGASIVVSDGMYSRLLLLADSTGRPLWNINLNDAGPDRFLGKAVYVSPDLAAPGANAKSMLVGDFRRGYWIRRVDGVTMQRQNELHSDNGQVGFRAYVRLDGRTVLADAMRVIAFAAT